MLSKNMRCVGVTVAPENMDQIQSSYGSFTYAFYSKRVQSRSSYVFIGICAQLTRRVERVHDDERSLSLYVL